MSLVVRDRAGEVETDQSPHQAGLRGPLATLLPVSQRADRHVPSCSEPRL